MKKILLVVILLFACSFRTSAQENFRFSGELGIRGAVFHSRDTENSIQGELRNSLRLEYLGDSWEMKLSTIPCEGYPNDMYDQKISAYHLGTERPAVLINEFFLKKEFGDLSLQLGRFIPVFRNQIKFDFYRMDPFASTDFSEPFLSLDDDRLLGNWGGLASYDFGLFALEFMAFVHEDPIISTDSKNNWTRPLPFDLSYGDFNSSKDIDWGARLSGSWWELSFFNGSSQSVDHLELAPNGKEMNLIFPEQTVLEGALQIPVSEFNLRIGAAQNWRRWHRARIGEFINLITEIEYTKENLFLGGDNIFVELGYANVWDIDKNLVLQSNLGMDQIYRGGSLLATVEYSPSSDWVFKTLSIYNIKNSSFYVSPEVLSSFFTDFGEIQAYIRCMLISGSSNDIISAYSKNDNIELGTKFFF